MASPLVVQFLAVLPRTNVTVETQEPRIKPPQAEFKKRLHLVCCCSIPLNEGLSYQVAHPPNLKEPSSLFTLVAYGLKTEKNVLQSTLRDSMTLLGLVEGAPDYSIYYRSSDDILVRLV